MTMVVHMLRMKLVVMASIALVLSSLMALSASVAFAMLAGATAPAATVDLLTATEAAAFGYTQTIDAPNVQSVTGLKNCPEQARAGFEDGTGATGLVSEVYLCTSVSAAAALMKNAVSGGQPVTGFAMPRALGSTAKIRAGQNSTYVLFWLRGSTVELVGLSTNVGSTSTSTNVTPMTAAERTQLAQAATKQNTHYVAISAHGPESAQAKANAVSRAAGCPATPSTALKKPKWSSAPPMSIDPSKTYVATVKTDLGTFVVTLDAQQAPATVNSFVFLADHQFYDCVTFHRVIPTFVDQTGDPTGTGSGGPGYTIPDEYPAKGADPQAQYALGAVAMANTGAANSGGSQWFVVAGPEGEALPPTYSLFGQVTSGLNVVQAINGDGSAQGSPPTVVHRILSVTISTS
jgi:cyclophilin family peptidyl-prolyl cis-trans isomerase